MGRHKGTDEHAGWESLRAAVYRQAVLDYKDQRHHGLSTVGLRKFLLSGAYQMDPQIGEEIIRRLEAEYVG